MKRVLYFLYYLRKLDWEVFRKCLKHVRKHYPDASVSWLSILRDSLRYNISILEYFQFGFYNLHEKDKINFAGTGFMFEYQQVMNPKGSRAKLADKIQFHKTYKPFIRNRYIANDELLDKKTIESFLASNEKVVLKNSLGQCGEGVLVRESKELNSDNINVQLGRTGNDYIEGYIQQHHKLNELSPSGLNTIRLITQLDKENKVNILGARLRITINSTVDNLAAGNIASPVDLQTGKVNGPGVYSDITKEDESIHPVTGKMIEGFEVPYWQETIELANRAALHNISNRSIGWDIAITNEGPELLEGNHDWCKLLWQLPVKKGLKPMLLPYLIELN